MKYSLLLFFVFIFSAFKTAGANTLPVNEKAAKTERLIRNLIPDSTDYSGEEPDNVSGENKRVIAAILAFPLPFGVLGLHRIYLGTDAWVPVAYVVTLGGFGVLSLIDFIYIIAASDEAFEALSHNGQLFVWVK